MKNGALRGWPGQLAIGVGVAVVMAGMLGLGLAHRGTPGHPAGAPAALATAIPAATSPAAESTPTPAATATAATPTPLPTPIATAEPTPSATPLPSANASAWHLETAPSGTGPLMGLTCVDAAHCWAAGEDPTGFGAAEIIATTDGGATWTAQSVPRQPASLQAVFDVSRLTVERCVAIAATSGGELTSVALTTDDGGSRWTQHTLPAAGQNGITHLDCVAPSTCHAFGADRPTGTTGTNVLDTSTDGGATWTAAATPDALCTLNQSCQLFAMTFVDATDGWLVGGTCPSPGSCTGIIMSTSDGGATWHTAYTGGGAILGIWCAGLSTSTDCEAVGVSESLRSIDGGRTWTVRPAPTGLNGVSCADALRCVAVGAESRPTASAGLVPQVSVFATTADGGATWTTRTLPTDTSNWLNRVTCTGSSCLAAGGSQVVVDGTSTSGTHALLITVPS